MSFITQEICESVSSKIYAQLENIGLLNTIEFLCSDPEEIVQKSNITFKDVLALRRVLLSTKSCLPVSGDDMYDDVMTSVAILSTGCSSVDNMLDGGLYTSEVTEIYGAAGTGKTQLCLSTALTVARESEQMVCYIDTGGGCDVDRLQDMLHTTGLGGQDCTSVLSRVVLYQAYDVFELLTQIEKLKNSSETCGCKLVIVDCIASVISPILGGQPTDGHSLLSHVGRALRTLATDFSLAVLVTNNAVSGDGGNLKPALGKSWSSVPSTRIQLRATHTPLGENGQLQASGVRTAALVRSCRQAVGGSGEFHITENGLQSVTMETR